jgi:hypothetical protein
VSLSHGPALPSFAGVTQIIGATWTLRINRPDQTSDKEQETPGDLGFDRE